MARRPSHMFNQNLAAYAASQPLLDAIHHGEISTARQGEKLAKASHIVRTVHVRLPFATGPQAAEDHNHSLDSIVAAWRNASEAYTEIFESLAEITAADASLGRAASRGHDEFRKMAESARMANKVANDWVSAAETSVPTRSSGSRRTSVDVEDLMDVDEVEEQMHPSGGNGVYANAEAVVELTAASGKAAKKKDELQQKREKKRALHREKIADLKAKKSDPTRPNGKGIVDDKTETNGGVKVPQVEYEDVSAEVEARLKAKEEKKKSKKAEKKRKRGSVDSVSLVERAGQSADKPRTKKARPSATASEQGHAAPAHSGKTSKRKRHDGNGGVDVEEGSKKRSRSK